MSWNAPWSSNCTRADSNFLDLTFFLRPSRIYKNLAIIIFFYFRYQLHVECYTFLRVHRVADDLFQKVSIPPDTPKFPTEFFFVLETTECCTI